MIYKCIILNKDAKVICGGTIEYFTSKEAVIIPEKKSFNNIGIKGKRINFQLEDDFEKIFSAVVEETKADSFSIYKILDVTSHLQTDLRISLSFITDIFCENEENLVFKTQVKMLDVSCGGLRFKSKRKFDEGQIAECVILWCNPELILSFKIISSKESQFGYVYGCKFLNLTDMEESVLRSSIFKFQSTRFKTKKRLEEAK